MNLLELQVLAVVSGIPDGNDPPSEQPARPAPAPAAGRAAALAAPPIERRTAAKHAV